MADVLDDNASGKTETQRGIEMQRMDGERVEGATQPLLGNDRLLNLDRTGVESETRFIDDGPSTPQPTQNDTSLMGSNDARTVTIITKDGGMVEARAIEFPVVSSTEFGDVDESTFDLAF